MPVFYPFGIPTTSSFAETASLALFTDLEIESASFADIARFGPSGSKGPPALPIDCALYGAEFREFPAPSGSNVIPEEVLAARQTYILCVETTTLPEFIVPTFVDGGAPNTINFELNIDGGEPATIHGFVADGGVPSTIIS